MNKHLKNLTAILLSVAVMGGSSLVMAAETPIGAAAALQDKDLTLSDMLTYAIQDEYLAQAEYDAIIKKYGSIRPFTNIIRAESQHISELLPLFTANEISVPENTAGSQVVLPDSLGASYTAGVQAEEQNIAMYQRFLKENLPVDVRAVLENLLAASNNHLQAFARSSSRPADIGSMKGSQSANRGWKNNQSGNYRQPKVPCHFVFK